MAQVDDYLRKQAAELLQAMNGGYYKEDNTPCQIEEGLFLGSFGAANDEEELNSVAVVVPYLLKKHGMTLFEALDHVKSGRARAAPNAGFSTQLYEYEMFLSGKS